MLINTKSYLLLRAYIQASLDYAYLTYHPVPALNAYIKADEKGSAQKIPNPDHFGQPEDHSRLKQIKESYKDSLGRFLLISTFSHFEAYIQNVVGEIFDFHGGSASLHRWFLRMDFRSLPKQFQKVVFVHTVSARSSLMA
jgi:hypothetical protein